MEAIKNLILLTGCLLLFACGGEGGGSEPSSVADDSGVNDPQALPNFTVVDFVAPSVIEEKGDSFQIEVTIQNNGVGAGDPDLIWVLSSASPDFSTGYRFSRHGLLDFTRVDDHTTLDLMPGETGVYRIQKTRLTLGIRGDHYVKLWVNPDKGENFDTREDRVTEEREIQESNYTDNFSEVATIYAPDGTLEECGRDQNLNTEDIFEENDSLESAHPIDLGLKYEGRLCLDHRDVFQVYLDADIEYEIIPDISRLGTWVLINPDLSYFMKPDSPRSDIVTSFKSTQTGLHYFAVYNSPIVDNARDSRYEFTIRQIP